MPRKEPKKSTAVIQFDDASRAKLHWTKAGASAPKVASLMVQKLLERLNEGVVNVTKVPPDLQPDQSSLRIPDLVDLPLTPIRVKSVLDFSAAMACLKSELGFSVVRFEPRSYFYAGDRRGD